MKYLINSNNFDRDKNFDFLFKDEHTISVLMSDENVEEITEFEVPDNEAWYVSFKVGSFISKVPKHNITFIKNCVLVTYERHPEQIGSIMRSQSKEYYEHLKKGAGKMVKKRKI